MTSSRISRASIEGCRGRGTSHAILRYFGDEAETLAGCGRCDVCRTLGHGEHAQDPEAVTLVVRKVLSGVARMTSGSGSGWS
jgi:hypothetical protein